MDVLQLVSPYGALNENVMTGAFIKNPIKILSLGQQV